MHSDSELPLISFFVKSKKSVSFRVFGIPLEQWCLFFLIVFFFLNEQFVCSFAMTALEQCWKVSKPHRKLSYDGSYFNLSNCIKDMTFTTH